MTATTVRESTRAPADHAPANVLAGTGTLIRFLLRRDRIKLPAWLLGMTVLLSTSPRSGTSPASTGCSSSCWPH